MIVGHTVYATKNGNGTNTPTVISSFELQTGAINWSYSGNFVFPSQAGVGNGFVVFVGSTISSPPSTLYVLDASTGFVRYTLSVPEGLTALMPTIVHDNVAGTTTAYVADGSHVTAVSLGATSGSVLWTQTGSFGGFSMPTSVGNSIIMAGPGQYYAIDKTTGAANHFHAGNISGGGGTTVAFDVSRSQFYVEEDYDTTTPTLSAYKYTNNSNITLLWQRTGLGVRDGQSVAIGSTGKIYTAGSSVIWELDPVTGATLRSISGSFANGMTPAISNGVVWTFSSNFSLTNAFDLNTLQLMKTLSGGRGDSNFPYDSPGAICNNHFLIDRASNLGEFDVYSAPGPVHLSSAVSRMTHGSAGTFDVNLPLTGSPGIECRSGGPAGNFKMVFTFDESLTGVVGGATITNGVGSITSSGIDPNDAHNYIVNLTGISNEQSLNVTLNNVSDAVGGFSSTVSAKMGVLLGDTNADGFVDAIDTVQVRSQAGNNVTGSNFPEDINADGLVNVGDTIIARAQSGTALPAAQPIAGRAGRDIRKPSNP
jgi:hypothetical protein